MYLTNMPLYVNFCMMYSTVDIINNKAVIESIHSRGVILLNLLSKKLLGNSMFEWLIFILVFPIGVYIIFIKHSPLGFIFLVAGTTLIVLFEAAVKRKKSQKQD